MNDDNDRQLKPASECIWYALATLAGEPEMTANPGQTRARNQELWNKFMSARAGRGELDPPTMRGIQHELWNRGFADGLTPGRDEPIDFSYVIFPAGTCFAGFNFVGTTTFKGARFDGQSHSFNAATFQEEVTFERAEFSGDFDAKGATFAKALRLDNANFNGNTAFEGSQFFGQSSFNSAQYQGDAEFHRCKFIGNATFMDTEFHSSVFFNMAEFETTVLFQRAQFRGNVPMFFEATLPEYTEWDDSKWPDSPTGYDQALDHIQRYQRLAKLMNQLEKFDDQRMFVRLEMRARRRIERWKVAGQIELWNIAFTMNWIYDSICGYGYGLTRVVILWLAHMVVGAGLLCLTKISVLMDEERLWEATRTAFSDFHLAFALSFGNSHGPLGPNGTFFAEVIKDWPWYEVIGPVQTVLGVIILFFLLLTIRNRFRIR